MTELRHWLLVIGILAIAAWLAFSVVGAVQDMTQAVNETTEDAGGEKTSENNKQSTKEEVAEPEEEDVEQEPIELISKSKSGLMILDPFTVNLNDPFGRRYAEVVMNLEIAQKEMVTQINENELVKPKLRDEIFMIISSKSYNELKSTSGKVTLKEEILMRVNEILKEEFGVEPVTGVYFTKFLIQ